MRDETTDAYARLYNRVDEILHYVWDPIGVAGIPEARDEYDSYLAHVVELLRTGVPAERIAEHLHRIEYEAMGLSRIGGASAKTLRVAELLVRNYQFVSRRSS